MTRTTRIPRSARRLALAALAPALAVSLSAAPVPASASASASGAAARPGRGVELSVEPDGLRVRECLPGTMDLRIANPSRRAVFADVTIEPGAPLETSRHYVSTYVPARGTVTVPVRVALPEGAEPGTYAVRFASGRHERVSAPVTAVAPPDRRCLPRAGMTATASSAQSPDYPPGNVLDGSEATIWHTRYSPAPDPLPQSVTIDLGRTYDVAELAYQPRTDGTLNGAITEYAVHASADGQTFTRVGEGAWALDRSRKTAAFDAPGARYIRLEALEGRGGFASAAEIVLFGRP